MSASRKRKKKKKKKGSDDDEAEEEEEAAPRKLSMYNRSLHCHSEPGGTWKCDLFGVGIEKVTKATYIQYEDDPPPPQSLNYLVNAIKLVKFHVMPDPENKQCLEPPPPSNSGVLLEWRLGIRHLYLTFSSGDDITRHVEGDLTVLSISHGACAIVHAWMGYFPAGKLQVYVMLPKLQPTMGREEWKFKDAICAYPNDRVIVDPSSSPLINTPLYDTTEHEYEFQFCAEICPERSHFMDAVLKLKSIKLPTILIGMIHDYI